MIALCLGASLPVSLARADDVSQADKDACTPDVFRLCQDLIPDEAPIVACLESKRTQLSPACERVMFPPAPAKPDVPAPERPARAKAKPAKHAAPKHAAAKHAASKHRVEHDAAKRPAHHEAKKRHKPAP
jgi:hypothetical protein